MESSKSSQSVVFRNGGLADLGTMLDALNTRRILFVVDPTAYSATAAADQLKEVFERRDTVHFNKFDINPKIEDVNRGLQLSNELSPDVVVAFGGGTAIDLAKMIRGLAAHAGNIDDCLTGTLPAALNRTPLVAIPTTSGTGSEATHFAVVYRNGEKLSVAHPDILPNFVILDPLLTYSVPKSVTAATGLDALCQAIESVWAVGATNESVEFAIQSLELSMAYLERAVNSPTPESRDAMCYSAHLAGKAINISKTTAPHALSYWLTSHYGIPHGAAVAIFLGRIMEFNAQVTLADCNDPRGPQNVQSRITRLLAVLNARDVESGRQRIEDLIAAIGGPRSLEGIGIQDPSALVQLAEKANVERLTNNPRRLDFSRLVELLHEPERKPRVPTEASATKGPDPAGRNHQF